MQNLLRKYSLAEILACLLLGVVALFSAYFSAKLLILNADATSGVYLFKDGHAWGDALIADWHTNLLKLPISFLQAHIPFTMATFTLTNAMLLFLMVAGWALGTAVVFGRKFFVPIALLLAFLLAGSSVLPTESAFTTIRNIEYPIYLLLVALFWKIFTRLKAGRALQEQKRQITLFVACMTLLQASDPFFTYATIPPILAIILYQAKTLRYSRQLIVSSIGLLLAPLVFAKIFIALIFHFGLFRYYGESMSPTVYEFSKIPGQFWAGIEGIIGLFNGNFFGLQIKNDYLDKMLLFGLFTFSLFTYVKSWKKIKHYIEQTPAYATLLIATGFLFTLYISFSAFESQARFLVIIVLTMCTSAIVWLLSLQQVVTKQTFHKHQRSLLIVAFSCVILMLGLGYRTYRMSNFYDFAEMRVNLASIDGYLASKHVNTIIAGHSYGSTLRFWSGSSLRYVPVLYCNQNLPFLTRESWYQTTPQTSQNVGLIVDKTGRDANSWFCSNDRIKQYYGKPLAHATMTGIDKKPVDVYIYPKSILHKIHFVEHKGTPKPLLAN